MRKLIVLCLMAFSTSSFALDTGNIDFIEKQKSQIMVVNDSVYEIYGYDGMDCAFDLRWEKDDKVVFLEGTACYTSCKVLNTNRTKVCRFTKIN